MIVKKNCMSERAKERQDRESMNLMRIVAGDLVILETL